MLAKDNHLLNGSVPHSVMTDEMTDISQICNFRWYEWVKFRKPGERQISVPHRVVRKMPWPGGKQGQPNESIGTDGVRGGVANTNVEIINRCGVE